MPLRIERVERFVINTHTRMPFKYGIASMTAIPHLFVRLTLDVDGRRATGVCCAAR